jgi:hypothetical protein
MGRFSWVKRLIKVRELEGSYFLYREDFHIIDITDNMVGTDRCLPLISSLLRSGRLRIVVCPTARSSSSGSEVIDADLIASATFHDWWMGCGEMWVMSRGWELLALYIGHAGVKAVRQ